ncbi:MAG: MFS transporter [Alphaproteobacteria bacterium]|nr:MFS transporter [Alphaproteobacteria bacterium]
MAMAQSKGWQGDARVISAVAIAHGLSHFFQLTLPPLFPAMKDEFGVGYAELGAVTGVFYGVSGVCQFGAGFVVDRFGSKPVLLAGMALLATATLAVGFAPGFWALLPLAVLAGLGNCVFHPADFAVLNARVGTQRLGRAYGAHGLAGNIGWVLAPIAGLALSKLFGWREAVMIMGAAGLVAAGLLYLNRDLIDDQLGERRHNRAEQGGDSGTSVEVLLQRAIVMCFAYFFLLSTALVGLQTFAVPASMAMFNLSDTLAAKSLTLFLIGSSIGIIVGAVLADRTERHHIVAAIGLTTSAALIFLSVLEPVPAVYGLPVLMALAGFAVGTTGPSRDSIVRRATPPGSSGRIYGFVYSGLDLGSTLAPSIFGLMVDRGTPVAVYAVVVGALLLSVFSVLDIRRQIVARQSGAASPAD